jgi:hypothetical protein
MYMHTSGDSPDNVAPTGLEAATRAFARIIDKVNKLPLSDLQRPLEPRAPRIDFRELSGVGQGFVRRV